MYNNLYQVTLFVLTGLTPSYRVLIEDTLELDFMKKFIDLWSKHDTALKMVRDINMYLDRNFVVKEKQKDIYTMGHILFKKYILRDSHVYPKFINFILDRLNEERMGEKIEREVLRGAIKILIELGFGNNNVYKKDFEKTFLEKSHEFYHNEAVEKITTHTSAEYLQVVQNRLDEEQERCLDFLIEETKKPLIKKVLTPMIEEHSKVIINKAGSGLGTMIKLKQYSNIHLMYKIFSQVPSAINLFEKFLVETVTEDCNSIIQDSSIKINPKDFIDRFIDTKQKYNAIIQQSCEKDNELGLSIKNAFEDALSRFDSSSSFLAKYIDLKMKKEIKTLKDEEIATIFNKILEIFRLLPEKDEFEGFYRNNLTKRLLTGTAINDEAEKLMISKLKVECGFQFTAKLETMMKDMTISENLNQQFKQYPYSSDIDYGFEIKVLTSGNWSNESQSTHCNIPKELAPAIKNFTDFYMKNHSGRILTWKMNFGSADVTGFFEEKDYELTVSGYQMIVLLLFNDAEKLSVLQLKSLSGIKPDYEFKRHVLSLIKVKLLLK
jgi:cullin 3